jgi:aquaporin Z
MRGPRLAAEAIGTFMLVLVGPGAAAVDRFIPGSVSHTGVALAFAFVLVAAVYALGHVSGAHFNPAVTIGFWLSRRFPGSDAGPYVAAQLAGAIGAALLLRMLLGEAAVGSVTTTILPVQSTLAVEGILTFFLMLVIMAVATDARVTGAVAGLAIGATIGGEALMAGPLTGASMNPARSFGPALANAAWSAHWIYWVAPIVGAGLAVFTYDYLRQGTRHV